MLPTHNNALCQIYPSVSQLYITDILQHYSEKTERN